MGAVTVVQTREYEVALEWESNAANDMIADSVLALILGIDASPASVKSAPLFYFSRLSSFFWLTPSRSDSDAPACPQRLIGRRGFARAASR